MTTLKEAATLDEEIAEIDKTDAAADTVVAEQDSEPNSKAKRIQKNSAVADAHDDATEDARRIAWPRVLAFWVLPGLALVLALVVGYVNWLDRSADDFAVARSESVRVASDDTAALLSYRPESVERDLGAARERLTGDFKDAYTALIREVVIPGAKEKRIAARARVTAAASVSATESHAVVLAFVNQTVTIGEGAPTDTTPVLRVTLDKVNGKWLVSHFDPV
jgi:Mce-associated membrane protein